MCVANSPFPEAPVIPITHCLGCGVNVAQPQNGMCALCEKRKGTWPLIMGVALIVAVLGLVTP